MKKTILYTSIIFSVIVLLDIIKIIAFDFERLTRYGFGYLVGKILLFLIFVVLAIFIKKSQIKKKSETDSRLHKN